ncbi:MAG TPA: serine hydrolase domain-containing protein [Streptosporangiaceae bacterium]|nr:serine hydrolase domain-containing protein [Streptosporangiaceae bacterium]
MKPVTNVAADLEARAASFVKENRLPGAAVGVVHGTDLAWSAGVGFADVSTRRSPKATTLHRMASITKTFTGTAVMRLHEDGRLHLDDPAVAYLPELRGMTSAFGPVETVTIRRMLSHESGLASEPPGTDWTMPVYEGAPGRTLERAAEIGTKVRPNTQLKYSNLAYQLLGEIVARVSQTPYPQYVKEEILDPLAMSATGFEPLPAMLDDRRATGYAPRALSDELDPARAVPRVWAEGGLWSCVEDLARWVAFQLGAHADRPRPSPVLAAAPLRGMHKPRYLGDDAWTLAWGVSWYAIRRDDVVWIQHSGNLPGFSANVCFDPRRQVGAVALINGTGDAAGLAMDLATIARGAVSAARPAVEPPATTPDAYRALLGIYASSDLGLFLRLEWRDGKLMFVDPDEADWRPVLAPTGDPDTFIVEPGCRQSGEPAIFRRLADGRVASVHLAAMTLIRLDRVGPAS